MSDVRVKKIPLQDNIRQQTRAMPTQEDLAREKEAEESIKKMEEYEKWKKQKEQDDETHRALFPPLTGGQEPDSDYNDAMKEVGKQKVIDRRKDATIKLAQRLDEADVRDSKRLINSFFDSLDKNKPLIEAFAEASDRLKDFHRLNRRANDKQAQADVARITNDVLRKVSSMSKAEFENVYGKGTYDKLKEYYDVLRKQMSEGDIFGGETPQVKTLPSSDVGGDTGDSPNVAEPQLLEKPDEIPHSFTDKYPGDVRDKKDKQPSVATSQKTAPTTTTTTPETDDKKKDEDVTDTDITGWDKDIPTWEDMEKRYNNTVNELGKEKKSAQQFYSRIFSVPEWFPKGLDEFREKKKELTDKPVYDKKSGKYVRNTTGEMATAKAEQKMAEDALSGMEDELRKMYVGVSDIQKEQKQADKAMKEAEEVGKKNYVEYIDTIRKEDGRVNEDDRLKDKEDFINEAKIDAGLATYDPTTGETHSYDENKKTTKELIQDQKAAIDAIKNGDLKDANEAVDNLKEEYRAAKRKLIKENAGNIARNVWFIVDLVTTMNRNAARLMPQGKYSPNLGNFETPALFQDYAAQLQGMRDTYNKANEKALMNNIDLETLRGKGAVDAQNEILKTAPESLRETIRTHFDKIRGWNNEAIQEALIWANANAGIAAEDAKAKNDFIRKTEWFVDRWGSLTDKQRMAAFQLGEAMASDDKELRLYAMKELLEDVRSGEDYRDYLQRIAAMAYEKMYNEEDRDKFIATIQKVQATLDSAQKVDDMFINTLNAFKPFSGSKTTQTTKDAKGGITKTITKTEGK